MIDRWWVDLVLNKTNRKTLQKKVKINKIKNRGFKQKLGRRLKATKAAYYRYNIYAYKPKVSHDVTKNGTGGKQYSTLCSPEHRGFDVSIQSKFMFRRVFIFLH